jgi:uncharacterized membrane protein YgcG
MRTKKRSETWNATSNRYDYPQSPSRIMLSLWPAGLPTNGKGTIDWAGGLINWNSPYMQNGYYYAMFEDVNVQCYQPPQGTKFSGGKAYVYSDMAGTNDTITGTDKLVVLKSLFASGDDPNADPNAKASGSSAKPSATPESVPGVSGAGARNEDGTGSGSSGSGASASSGAAGSASTGASGGGFSQGGGGSSGGVRVQERLGGSVFAVLVAVGVALCW